MKKVNNPLTIVAIFAGLAEVACTGALIYLDSQIQSTFVWFVMLFPTALLLLFFVTLWWKPTSLYAPSDYSNEKNFLEAIGVTISLGETIDVIKQGLEELEQKIEAKSQEGATTKELESQIDFLKENLSKSQKQLNSAQQALSQNSDKTRVNLSISSETIDKLKVMAEERGVSVSTVIKEILGKNYPNDKTSA